MQFTKILQQPLHLKKGETRQVKVKRYFRKNWQLWIMLLPAMLYILIFCYVPMYGIQLAFRDYDFTKGITGGAWAGLKYFKQYFDSPMFWVTLKIPLSLHLQVL